jgi:hypothetical protein
MPAMGVSHTNIQATFPSLRARAGGGRTAAWARVAVACCLFFGQ